jgi:hypothetical protein
MSEHPTLDPDEMAHRVRQLREAMSRMSIDELCNLIRDIQDKMRGAAKDRPAAKK